jgi:hypothetical protein
MAFLDRRDEPPVVVLVLVGISMANSPIASSKVSLAAIYPAIITASADRACARDLQENPVLGNHEPRIVLQSL